MRTLSFLFFFALGLSAQAPANADYRGLYVVWPQVAGLPPIKVTQLTNALYVPGISGFVLDVSWAAIEPSRGQYQWGALDSWLLPAVAAGKKLDVGIEAGTFSPSWLYDAPPSGAAAVPINFVWSDQGGANGQCTPITMPLPWDAAFLSEWDAMLNALSAHLKAVGAYGSVNLVRLTGVNTNSDELKLPVTTPTSTGLSCVTDAIAAWQKAGYTPTQLLKGWDQITNSFQTHFPDKTLVLPVLVANALPPIDDNGNMMKGSRQEDNLAEVEMAAKKFPSRLVVLQTTIQLGTPAGTEMSYAAHTLHTAIAFQTNEWLNSGAACGGTLAKPVPCTTALFAQMMDFGIHPFGSSDPVRSPFIEVFPPNALALPDAMVAAFNAIVPDAAPAVIPNNGVVIHGGTSSILSPGSLVDIYGTNLPAHEALAPGGQNLPLGLGGSTISVAGIAAPLLYAGPGTVVFQMPFNVPTGQASVTLSVNGAPSLPVRVTVNPAATELLTWGNTRAVVQNQDYSLNTPENGARSGSTAITYLTGSGPLNHAVVTGAPSPSSPPAMETETTTVMLGGARAVVSFAGMCPGLVGVVQVNFVVPLLAPGDYPLQITIGNAASNSAQMTVL